MSFLQVDDVSKHYPSGFEALRKLNLKIEEGEFVSLIGPSGSGKSTTIGLVAAFHKPSSGKVLVVGGYNSGSGTLASAELYDSATNAWNATGALATTRNGHTATLLASGEVLVAGGGGGSGTLASAEIYDPATGKWTASGQMTYARWYHTSTPLANGQILICGGNTNNIFPTTAELFDVGLGFSNSWQPQIVSFDSQFALGSSLNITGSQFRGISGASSGNTQDSAADYPLVQLRSIESGQTTFLLTTNWSTNSFTSLPVWNFPPGWAMATVFVNGIPSTSSIVNIPVPVPTPPTIIAAKKSNGTFQFSFTNSVGAVFGALASTNVSLPLSNWTALSGVTEVSPGQFQFTDPQATNSPPIAPPAEIIR